MIQSLSEYNAEAGAASIDNVTVKTQAAHYVTTAQMKESSVIENDTIVPKAQSNAEINNPMFILFLIGIVFIVVRIIKKRKK